MITIAIVPLFIGTTELLLIGGLALLLFGGKKLPEMMKGLGQGVKSFKQGMNEPIPEENAQEENTEAQATQQEPQEKSSEEENPSDKKA